MFLQTPLLGCYKIKTIFSLSKCFPSRPLETHNSPAHFQLRFSWGQEEMAIESPVSSEEAGMEQASGQRKERFHDSSDQCFIYSKLPQR